MLVAFVHRAHDRHKNPLWDPIARKGQGSSKTQYQCVLTSILCNVLKYLLDDLIVQKVQAVYSFNMTLQ